MSSIYIYLLNFSLSVNDIAGERLKLKQSCKFRLPCWFKKLRPYSRVYIKLVFKYEMSLKIVENFCLTLNFPELEVERVLLIVINHFLNWYRKFRLRSSVESRESPEENSRQKYPKKRGGEKLLAGAPLSDLAALRPRRSAALRAAILRLWQAVAGCVY